MMGNTAMTGSADPAKIEDLVFECDLQAPPAKVWRALTIPEYVELWLAPATFELQANSLCFDGRAEGLSGAVECTLLAAEPPRHLRYAWGESDGATRLDSIGTFDLQPKEDGGTHLRITHGDFTRRPTAANLNEPVMMLLAA